MAKGKKVTHTIKKTVTIVYLFIQDGDIPIKDANSVSNFLSFAMILNF